MDVPSHAKMPAQAPRPTAMPMGMPMMAMMPPSSSTERRSWRLDAPIEASRPNCRMRSLTEMAKVL